MALTVAVTKESKQASEWCDYKDEDGNVLARFKVRGIGYKPYQVSLERVQTYLQQQGHEVGKVKQDAKYNHEYLIEAMAHHLIADWDDVELSFDGGETFKRVEYTPENALKLLQTKEIGLIIWGFIFDNATRIQDEAEKEREEVLGKSENSTTTQNSEVNQKPRAQRKKATQ